MALTIEVLSAGRSPRAAQDGRPGGDPPGDGALSISVDAPRIVIGRGDGCEVWLPDPSVSHRHASIRQRGADYQLVDEGSDNGTFLGKTRLPPHSPAPLRSGDKIRVGRVWLAIRVEPGPALGYAGARREPGGAPIAAQGAAAARELALELVARGLAAQGEDATPKVLVLEGADHGAALRLEEVGRHYVIGRARDADLPLDDADASRRHVAVARRGDGFVAHDLGSRGGALLDGVPLPQVDTPWRPGQILELGRTALACEHPAAEALAELERSPCEPLRAGEAMDLTEPEAAAEAPTPTPAPPPLSEDAALPRAGGGSPTPPALSAAGGWGLADAAVVLLALGVLALSVAGLLWLLGRG